MTDKRHCVPPNAGRKSPQELPNQFSASTRVQKTGDHRKAFVRDRGEIKNLISRGMRSRVRFSRTWEEDSMGGLGVRQILRKRSR